MLSILFRFIVTFFVLIIAVVVVYIWVYKHQTQQSNSNLSSTLIQEMDLPKETSEPMNLGEYYGHNRKPLLTCKELSSVETASKVLNEKVQSAKRIGKVVKRGFKLNENGKRVGQRFEIYYCCGEEGQESAQIYWTTKAKFCYITAANVPEALEFEKNNP